MAISMLSRTTSEITLYVPNMVAPTNSVNSWRAFTLVTYRFNSPNMDQKRDWRVSNNLRTERGNFIRFFKRSQQQTAFKQKG